jgi:hypothetical protein
MNDNIWITPITSGNKRKISEIIDNEEDVIICEYTSTDVDIRLRKKQRVMNENREKYLTKKKKY